MRLRCGDLVVLRRRVARLDFSVFSVKDSHHIPTPDGTIMFYMGHRPRGRPPHKPPSVFIKLASGESGWVFDHELEAL